MVNKTLLNSFLIYLVIFFPISILVGPAISLSVILLISLSSAYLLLINKKLSLDLNDKIPVYILISIYLYLIFNNLISIDKNIGLERNLGFFRYILFFIIINYLFNEIDDKIKNYIFYFWILIFAVVLFDIIYEFSFKENILGFVSPDKKRIVSFFKDELVVGTFINGFFFILIGFLIDKNFKRINYKLTVIILFLLLSIIVIVLTGERSNTIKFFIGLLILFFFDKKIKKIFKISFFVLFLLILIIAIFNSTRLMHRYNNNLIQNISSSEKINEYIYFKLYKTGIKIFKEYPYFGIGNKNYRVVSCEKKYIVDKKLICNSHPHQVYIEFLSEHGLIGTIILLSLLYFLIFRLIVQKKITLNSIQIGALSYLMINFIPVLPSGSFFSDFNSNFFWLNLSIMYAVSSDRNIFKKNN